MRIKGAMMRQWLEQLEYRLAEAVDIIEEVQAAIDQKLEQSHDNEEG